MLLETNVEVVLMNWKRPENIPIIMDALRKQDYPCLITLLDNAAEEQFQLPQPVKEMADKYLFIPEHPFGPYLRYACFGFYEKDYIFFIDDDMKPGRNCVRHFYNYAKLVNGFGSISSFGRIISNRVFTFRCISQPEKQSVPVDLCIRCYFIHREIGEYFPEITRTLFQKQKTHLFWHDDMLLSAICRRADKSIFVIPQGNAETQFNENELSTHHALSSEVHRFQKRQAAWNEICDLFDTKF
jgi:hypothetical protein